LTRILRQSTVKAQKKTSRLVAANIKAMNTHETDFMPSYRPFIIDARQCEGAAAAAANYP